MKSQIFFIVTFSITVVLFFCNRVDAQDLEPGKVLPELTPEQRMERLTTHLNAIIFSIIDYVVKQGEDLEEIGRHVGELFAKSWPDDATPEFYVTSMNNNWQMYGVTTEVIEVKDDYIKARRGRVQFDENMERAYQNVYGYGIAEFEKFFRYVEKGITTALELEISQRVEDEYIVFTVTQ